MVGVEWWVLCATGLDRAQLAVTLGGRRWAMGSGSGSCSGQLLVGKVRTKGRIQYSVERSGEPARPQFYYLRISL